MIENSGYYPPLNYTDEEKLIWQLLINRDFTAFCSSNWSLIENDFIKDVFFGIDGKKSQNKQDWSLTFPSLESYKRDWIKQSLEFNSKIFTKDPLDILFKQTKLSKIEITEDFALVNKEFNAILPVENEKPVVLDWISLFVLQKIESDWKIKSFTGYLPRQ